jgi:hypothetical protein
MDFENNNNVPMANKIESLIRDSWDRFSGEGEDNDADAVSPNVPVRDQKSRLKEKLLKKDEIIQSKDDLIAQLTAELNETKQQRIESEKIALANAYTRYESQEELVNQAESELLKSKIQAYKNQDFENVVLADDAITKIRDNRRQLEQEKLKAQSIFTQLSEDTVPMPNNNSFNQQTYTPQQPPSNPNLGKFLEEFPFLNPSDTSNYSPAMVAKVQDLTSKMNTYYKLNKRGDEIWDDNYLDEMRRKTNEFVREFSNNAMNSSIAPLKPKKSFVQDFSETETENVQMDAEAKDWFKVIAAELKTDISPDAKSAFAQTFSDSKNNKLQTPSLDISQNFFR